MNFDASVIHSLNTKLAVTQLETRTAVRRHCTASYVLVTSRHPTPKTSKQTNKIQIVIVIPAGSKILLKVSSYYA